jgi:hypothetical protein
LQEKGVKGREDCGVHCDIERECEDGDAGEVGAFAEHAEGVTNVGEKAFDGRPALHRAAIFFHQSDISELAPGGVRGFCPGHTVRHQLFDLFFEVLAYFVGEIVVEAAAREEFF